MAIKNEKNPLFPKNVVKITNGLFGLSKIAREDTVENFRASKRTFFYFCCLLSPLLDSQFQKP
jgi:hypothetical protein